MNITTAWLQEQQDDTWKLIEEGLMGKATLSVDGGLPISPERALAAIDFARKRNKEVQASTKELNSKRERLQKQYDETYKALNNVEGLLKEAEAQPSTTESWKAVETLQRTLVQKRGELTELGNNLLKAHKTAAPDRCDSIELADRVQLWDGADAPKVPRLLLRQQSVLADGLLGDSKFSMLPGCLSLEMGRFVEAAVKGFPLPLEFNKGEVTSLKGATTLLEGLRAQAPIETMRQWIDKGVEQLSFETVPGFQHAVRVWTEAKEQNYSRVLNGIKKLAREWVDAQAERNYFADVSPEQAKDVAALLDGEDGPALAALKLWMDHDMKPLSLDDFMGRYKAAELMKKAKEKKCSPVVNGIGKLAKDWVIAQAANYFANVPQDNQLPHFLAPLFEGIDSPRAIDSFIDEVLAKLPELQRLMPESSAKINRLFVVLHFLCKQPPDRLLGTILHSKTVHKSLKNEVGLWYTGP